MNHSFHIALLNLLEDKNSNTCVGLLVRAHYYLKVVMMSVRMDETISSVGSESTATGATLQASASSQLWRQPRT